MLTLLGFAGSSEYLGAVFGGRNALHCAASGGLEELQKLLAGDSVTNTMLMQRDITGATPFFLAMQSGLVAEACAIRAAAESGGIMAEMIGQCNLYGTPPLHALLGLDQGSLSLAGGEQKGGVGVDSSAQLGQLRPLLLGPSGETLMTTTNVAGHTALQAFICQPPATNPRGGASRPVVDALVRLLSTSSVAVKCCLPQASSAEADDKLDLFVFQLVSRGGALPVNFARAVAASELRRIGQVFMQSCVRVYCALYAGKTQPKKGQGPEKPPSSRSPSGSAGGSAPKREPDNKQETFSAIFQAAPALAIESLARTADKATYMVRLGLPMQPVTEISSHGQILVRANMNDSGYIAGIFGGDTPKTPSSWAGRASSASPSAEGSGASAGAFVRGDSVQLKSSTPGSQTQGLPLGATGTIHAIHSDGESATVGFTIDGGASPAESGERSPSMYHELAERERRPESRHGGRVAAVRAAPSMHDLEDEDEIVAVDRPLSSEHVSGGGGGGFGSIGTLRPGDSARERDSLWAGPSPGSASAVLRGGPPSASSVFGSGAPRSPGGGLSASSFGRPGGGGGNEARSARSRLGAERREESWGDHPLASLRGPSVMQVLSGSGAANPYGAPPGVPASGGFGSGFGAARSPLSPGLSQLVGSTGGGPRTPPNDPEEWGEVMADEAGADWGRPRIGAGFGGLLSAPWDEPPRRVARAPRDEPTRRVSAGSGAPRAMAWRGPVEYLERAGGSDDADGASSGSDAPCPKVQRARIFHLCVKAIAEMSELRRRLSAPTAELGPTPSDGLLSPRTDAAALRTASLALSAAARMLQPAWEHVFDCCEIAEDALTSAGEQEQLPEVTSSSSAPRLPFAAFMQSAYGVADGSGCGAPPLDPSQYRYIAYMLDALVRFKQSLPPPWETKDQSKASAPSEAVAGLAVGVAPLVRSISMVQPLRQGECDALSATTRKQVLLATLNIDPDVAAAGTPVSAAAADPFAGDDVPTTREMPPLVSTLFGWRRTLVMLSEHYQVADRDPDSFFHLLEPFPSKSVHFRRTMHELVPHGSSSGSSGRSGRGPRGSGGGGGSHEKLLLKVQRGDRLSEDVFTQLAELRSHAPAAGESNGPESDAGSTGTGTGSGPWLCRALEDTKPWFVDGMGEGKGVVRALVAEFSAAIKTHVATATPQEDAGAEVAPAAAMPLLSASPADAAKDGDAASPGPWCRLVPVAQTAAAPAMATPEPEPEPSSSENGESETSETSETEEGSPPDSSRLAPPGAALERFSTANSSEDAGSASTAGQGPPAASAGRLEQYRSLGNIAGLCLLHGGEEFGLRLPLYFSRHVYKYLLGREVTFVDLAYHDPAQYESLSNLLKHASATLSQTPDRADEPLGVSTQAMMGRGGGGARTWGGART